MTELTEAEKRGFAILQSIASMRLEGGEISPFALDLMQKWARLEIEIDEVVDKLLEHYKAESLDSSSESPHHS